MRIERKIYILYGLLTLFFISFLIVPLFVIIATSFAGTNMFEHYLYFIKSAVLWKTLGNSILVSICTAIITVLLASILVITIQYTNLTKYFKGILYQVATLPMLLPSITYGFAIIFTFGKQGLLTRLLGFQLFEIYGFKGILLGYIIYTLAIAFLLLNNAISYIDKKYIVVSKLLKDTPIQTFKITLLRPLLPALVAAFIQVFFMAFTDFGIPASVGGDFQVIASLLYTQMLGSIPIFARGAVIAVFMLIPTCFSIWLLHHVDQYNIRYHKVSTIELSKNKLRDSLLGLGSSFIILSVVTVFLVILAIPFVLQWP